MSLSFQYSVCLLPYDASATSAPVDERVRLRYGTSMCVWDHHQRIVLPRYDDRRRPTCSHPTQQCASVLGDLVNDDLQCLRQWPMHQRLVLSSLKIPGTSLLSRTHLETPLRFRILVIGTTAAGAPLEARAPHGVRESIVTSRSAITARSSDTSRLTVGPSRLRLGRLSEQKPTQDRGSELLRFDFYDRMGP